MNPRIEAIVKKIKDDSLRRKVSNFIEDPSITIEGKTYRGLKLEESPASIHRHHNYPGGLLEHIISTARIALALCNSVEKVYHGKINRDLVISGVLVHDLYKTLTYEKKDNGAYRASHLAEKVDHLTLIVSELIRRGFPLDVIHTVCSHHGEAGPIRPKTVEALVLHLADLVDSQLNGEVLRAARFLVREATGETLEKVNAKEAFEIVHSKTIGGWDGVRGFLEEKTKKTIDG